MSIVNDTSFSFNKQFKFNFNGGELSSDGGLFLLKEFAHRIGFDKSHPGQLDYGCISHRKNASGSEDARKIQISVSVD